jgi:hypothetical protein
LAAVLGWGKTYSSPEQPTKGTQTFKAYCKTDIGYSKVSLAEQFLALLQPPVS